MAHVPDEAIPQLRTLSAAASSLYLYYCLQRSKQEGKLICPHAKAVAESGLCRSVYFKANGELLSRGWIERDDAEITKLFGFDSPLDQSANADLEGRVVREHGLDQSANADLEGRVVREHGLDQPETTPIDPENEANFNSPHTPLLGYKNLIQEYPIQEPFFIKNIKNGCASREVLPSASNPETPEATRNIGENLAGEDGFYCLDFDGFDIPNDDVVILTNQPDFEPFAPPKPPPPPKPAKVVSAVKVPPVIVESRNPALIAYALDVDTDFSMIPEDVACEYIIAGKRFVCDPEETRRQQARRAAEDAERLAKRKAAEDADRERRAKRTPKQLANDDLIEAYLDLVRIERTLYPGGVGIAAKHAFDLRDTVGATPARFRMMREWWDSDEWRRENRKTLSLPTVKKYWREAMEALGLPVVSGPLPPFPNTEDLVAELWEASRRKFDLIDGKPLKPFKFSTVGQYLWSWVMSYEKREADFDEFRQAVESHVPKARHAFRGAFAA